MPSLPDIFRNLSTSAYDAQWDTLWRQSNTPWDRNGPSPPLAEALTRLSYLRPSPGRRLRALVPGCGRGHDVLLLAGWGFDVVGVDLSGTAVGEAERVEERGGYFGEEMGREVGRVEFVVGDFFGEGLKERIGEFDLVFDYTFLCALPVSLRPRWASTIATFLRPAGHLICLEFPLGRSLSLGGPPHGLQSSVYLALLGNPGAEMTYNEDGEAVGVTVETVLVGEGGLRRKEIWTPEKTHMSGYDGDGKVADRVSVWSR